MKKIMFNDKYGLTQAVLEGRKTQTRRIMNPQPEDCSAVHRFYKSAYEYNPNLFPNGAGWTNKMYVKPELMPHRIRITAVSVEWLRDISDIDCMSEGINYYEQEGFSWCSTGKLFDTP